MRTKRVNIKSILRIGFAVGSIMMCAWLLPSGCVREDVSSCVQYNLAVKVVDTEGNDITRSGTVTSMALYMFDQNGFVRVIPKGTSTDYLIGEEADKQLTLVAWGNLKTDSLKVNDLRVGSSLQEAKVALLKCGSGNDMPSSDLFYSKMELTPITRGTIEDITTIVLQPLASRISIRTLSLNKLTSTNNCRIVVKGAGNCLNFLAQIAGDQADYEPSLTKDVAGDLYAAPFCVFPTQEDNTLSIEIYKEGQKIFSTSTDQEGNPLQAPAGKLLNVNIDFAHAGVKVAVSIQKWGTVNQDTQM